MTLCMRVLWGLIVTAAGLAGVGYGRLDWLGVGQGRGQRQREQRQGEELKRQSRLVLERVKVKTEVVHELLAGEMSLAGAAAWFGYLNDCPPDCRNDFRAHWEGSSDGEKLCRQVIRWAAAELREKEGPSRARARLKELEAELERLRGPDGVVVLRGPEGRNPKPHPGRG
jgi:hypothetical protein